MIIKLQQWSFEFILNNDKGNIMNDKLRRIINEGKKSINTINTNSYIEGYRNELIDIYSKEVKCNDDCKCLKCFVYWRLLDITDHHHHLLSQEKQVVATMVLYLESQRRELIGGN